jgi:hypothetical protein
MEDVHAHFPRHSAAAREFAAEHFDSRRRLAEMLEISLSSSPAGTAYSAASTSAAARSPERTAPSM